MCDGWYSEDNRELNVDYMRYYNHAVVNFEQIILFTE